MRTPTSLRGEGDDTLINISAFSPMAAGASVPVMPCAGATASGGACGAGAAGGPRGGASGSGEGGGALGGVDGAGGESGGGLRKHA